jgi:hypothetical protein
MPRLRLKGILRDSLLLFIRRLLIPVEPMNVILRMRAIRVSRLRTAGAATKLGIPASTLESKIRTLGIEKHRFKVR